MAYLLLPTNRQVSALVSLASRSEPITLAVDRSADSAGNGEVCLGLADGPTGRALTFAGWVRSAGGASDLDRRLSIDRVHILHDPIPTQLLRQRLSRAHQRSVDLDISQGVGLRLTKAGSKALLDAIVTLQPQLEPVLNALVGVDRTLNSPAANRWCDERDAVRVALRIAGLDDKLLLQPWMEPSSPSMPFLAGLSESTPEAALLDHDARSVPGLTLLPGFRADIHVFQDSHRTLEVTNVNATNVEAALGTDLIYYTHRTRSLVLVQYKKLKDGEYRVDARFRSQLGRMLKVDALGVSSLRSADWRLGARAAWFKLAEAEPFVMGSNEMVQGQYLHAEYVTQLLEDDCTRGPRKGRILGYETVDRHLTNTLFISLVKDGWIGTSGVALDDLRRMVRQSLRDDNSVVLAEEKSATRYRNERRRRRVPR
ncbi:hypothetical protein ACFPJ1_02295 [Kribbella qitaiheensis]|uniref:hypothetical protein n=1 Tax=Kribbella qitaiheensis TaxID=1544730 RepID=UPI0036215A84